MSTIKASGLGPLTASNTATIVDPATPLNGSATMSPLVSFASQATTSGTSFDFIGIPSWAKRITVMFNGVSTNGTSNPLIQIGSGSVTTTGYLAGSRETTVTTAGGGSSSAAGFAISAIAGAAVLYGHMILTQISTNVWVSSHVVYLSQSGSYAILGGGSVTLSGTLDRVRITTVNGTDAFDAGAVNVMYE